MATAKEYYEGVHGKQMAFEYKPEETGVEGMRIIADSTEGFAESSAGKIMTQQQASLHAPDSMGFDFQYADKYYEEAMEASGLGMLGYTGCALARARAPAPSHGRDEGAVHRSPHN